MEKVTLSKVKQSKVQGQKISMLTAYDYPMAKILDEACVDIVLVGDSLGNVVLGYENTLPVTMEDMIHHAKAVARGVKRALLVVDMPSKAAAMVEAAVKNAKLLQTAGAEAVKVEGVADLESIKAIIAAGLPVMGHIGLLPQQTKEYKIQRSEVLIDQARQLEAAGVFALVLEMVEPELAKKISASVEIPTIGIGSGQGCNGQVLVTHDLIGLSAWSPKFVKRRLNLKEEIKKVVAEWCVSP